MFLLLLLTEMVIVYIVSFKNNFNQEDIAKVSAVVILTSVLIFVCCIVASITHSRIK